MLDTDSGSRFLGECAIGTNYQIRQYTRSTLFDEKIGGTVHFALGAGYPETGNSNQSGLHWDMVVDLRKGGHVMLSFDQVTTSLPFIKSGKLRALGVSTRKRSPVLPNVPTIEEAGLPGFNDSTFNGLIAPAGTPRAIVERLRDAVSKAAALSELHSRFLDQGIELIASPSSDEFSAYLRKQVEEFAILARQAGMTEK